MLKQVSEERKKELLNQMLEALEKEAGGFAEMMQLIADKHPEVDITLDSPLTRPYRKAF